MRKHIKVFKPTDDEFKQLLREIKGGPQIIKNIKGGDGMEKTIIWIKVKIDLSRNVSDAIVEEIISEVDYNFKHELIEETEIVDIIEHCNVIC